MPRRTTLPWIIVVVCLALTGASAAVASPTVVKAISKATVKKIAKKSADKEIAAKASSLSVAKAKTADSATTAANATSADSAKVALSPIAYAVVNADGTIVAASSRGITQAMLVKRLTSSYCFTVPFAFKTAQTTPVYDGSDGDVKAAVANRTVDGKFGVQAGDCLASENLEVATSVDSTFATAPFEIWFYN